MVFLPHVKSTNSTMLYYASTISSHANCTYSSIGISSLPRFKEEMRLANLFAASFILDLLCSFYMAKSALQFVGKIFGILQLFPTIWRFISLHTWLRAPHNSMPYIRHYFPQVMMSSRIKIRENPSQKILLIPTLNKAIIPWSNGCATLVTLGGEKTIKILLKFKVQRPNDSPLPTC